MNGTDRLRSEIAFHDSQAQDRAATFRRRPEGLSFEDDLYLDHENWIRPAFRQLQDLQNRRALDYGCGHGMGAVVLARRGAQVTAFDLSPGYLEEAKRRARANDVNVNWVQANAEQLPFADGLFERIWGNAVLHHLDLGKAAREIRRVLHPDGVAVFCEPWGENPLLSWARRRLPYPGKARTPDEQPLRRKHLSLLRRVFAHVEVRGFQLLSMGRRVLPRGRVVAGLDWCDDLLLARVPALQEFCRYVVITLRR
jgi:ubiquinone/menaquinone biosynthesis C-methylase UbiE